jgi:D-alanyl-D-alanine carboxypeptidase
VVLGAPGEAFTDGAALLNHGYAAFERRTVIAEGQRLGPVEVGDRPVPAVAGAAVEVLLSRGEPVSLKIRPEPGLGLPVDDGQRLGVVEAVAGGVSLGEAPLLAAASVSLSDPGEEQDPWWLRALEAVGRAFARVVRAIFG